MGPGMYGVFFEEINHAGDGGLYAELVNNRSFEELEMPEGYRAENGRLYPKPVVHHATGKVADKHGAWTRDPFPAWSLSAPDGAASMRLTKDRPKFKTAPTNLEVDISNAAVPVRLVNSGYWGMNIVAGEKYILRTIIRVSGGYSGKITAKLLSENGDILSSVPVQTSAPETWSDSTVEFRAEFGDPKAKLALEFSSTGKVWVDYVSLFPEKTFKGRKNGLRKDVADFLLGLRPKFIRWPGGCVVEGFTLGNRFEWKKTLGDPAARPGEYSLWGYRCSYGMGYHEMLQFCEDAKADMMFVCNVGMGCQFRMGDVCGESEIDYYLQDCIDAIEYAIGDPQSSEWGRKRAEAGHPAPFPLKYVEIGNENFGDEYDKRFNYFYSVLKKRYPELTFISNHGLGKEGMGRLPKKGQKTDMIDPHWYVSPQTFFNISDIFDGCRRGDYKVYVGEYAVNQEVGGGNILGALAEAAFITGMERNSDLVAMASYAPLFENVHSRQWPVNLIWIDTDKVVGRSSYYVQKMSAQNRPDYNVKCSKTKASPRAMALPVGTVGLGALNANAEYKDIKIEREGRAVSPDISQMSGGSFGKWNSDGKALELNASEGESRFYFYGHNSDRLAMELKARKTGGDGGFAVYFSHDKSAGGRALAFDIGGTEGNKIALRQVGSGATGRALNTPVGYSLENGKWYGIKLVVSPAKAELFIDGTLVSEYTINCPLRFFAAGYDETAAELIVKIVNADAKPYTASIRIDGAESVADKGRVVSLSGDCARAENSLDFPVRVFPKESEFGGFSKKFNYTVEPFSYTILRVKAKARKGAVALHGGSVPGGFLREAFARKN